MHLSETTTYDRVVRGLYRERLDGHGETMAMHAPQWLLYEFWRFVFVQQQVAKLAETAIEFPPMQKGASFNLDAVEAKIEEAMKAHQQ